MSDTMKTIRGFLEEMFGEERAALLKDDDKPWHDAIGAKNIDRVDFGALICTTFDVQPHAFFFDGASLAEIVEYIDAMAPNAFPH